MPPVAVLTEAAPRAIGPYSQAIAVPAGPLVFCSGQIAIDPRSGELVGADDIRQQTQRVMENLQAVLQAAGSSLANVVKATIFLVDLGDFSAVNEIYGGYFSEHPPARSTVQVAALAPRRAGRDRGDRGSMMAKRCDHLVRSGLRPPWRPCRSAGTGCIPGRACASSRRGCAPAADWVAGCSWS